MTLSGPSAAVFQTGLSSPDYPQIRERAVLTPAAASATDHRSDSKDSTHALA